MASVHDVAQYFLTLADNEEAGDCPSNLKLQKLVYYAQGIHLALNDEPLFMEDIMAWQHGPVVPELYHRYKEYGGGAIPAPAEFDPTTFDVGTREILDEVYHVFGQYSAWKLRQMTHDEPPWRDAETGSAIGQGALKSYFLTQLV